MRRCFHVATTSETNPPSTNAVSVRSESATCPTASARSCRLAISSFGVMTLTTIVTPTKKIDCASVRKDEKPDRSLTAIGDSRLHIRPGLYVSSRSTLP